jgi:hypothetical protein
MLRIIQYLARFMQIKQNKQKKNSRTIEII